MTLEELLALLPDNTTEEISPADMRTIVSELWAQSAQALANVQTLRVATVARIDALEAEGNTRTAAGIWTLDPNPAHQPTQGEIVTDTGALADATLLMMHRLTRGGVDLGAAVASAQKLSLQSEFDQNNWVKFDVTGPIVGPDLNGDYTIPVTVTGSGGVIQGGNNGIIVILGWTVP